MTQGGAPQALKTLEKLNKLTVDIAEDGQASATLDDGSGVIVTSQKRFLYQIDLKVVRRLTAMQYTAIRSGSINEVQDIGKTLAGLVLPADVRVKLPPDGETLLLTTNDHEIPWELLYEKGFYSVRYALSRQLLTSRDIRAPEALEPGSQQKALIIANPTDDLPDAQKEANELQKFIRSKGIPCDFESRTTVTSEDLMVKFARGIYYIIHYSGHIDIDEEGAFLRLAGADKFYLKSALLFNIGRPFIFLNGCGGGPDFGGSEQIVTPLIYAGSGPILCSSMPITDKGGREFLEQIMSELFGGIPYGKAVRNARERFCFDSAANLDWMSFVLYGNPLDCITIPKEPDLMSDKFKTVLGRSDGLAGEKWVISTAHMFIALMMQEDEIIQEAFAALQYDSDAVEDHIAALFQMPRKPRILAVPKESRYSPNTLKAVNQALDKAKASRREAEPRDLMAALLTTPSNLTQQLSSIGIDCARILRQLE